jgi:hypothetical protein
MPASVLAGVAAAGRRDEPQDTVTEASVVGRQVHYWPGSYGSRGDSSHRVQDNAGAGWWQEGRSTGY